MYVIYKFSLVIYYEVRSDGDNLMYVIEGLLLLGTVVQLHTIVNVVIQYH